MKQKKHLKAAENIRGCDVINQIQHKLATRPSVPATKHDIQVCVQQGAEQKRTSHTHPPKQCNFVRG